MTKKERYDAILGWFEENRGELQSELHYVSPFQLLVAVILSAQCTDRRVNMVTPELFRRFPDAATLAAASFDDVYPYVKSISYPNSKTEHLIATARKLQDEFGGEVPSGLDELMSLPGVGRKTASVVASIVYDKPVIAVDTHVFRVSHRLGLSDGIFWLEPTLAIERDLMADEGTYVNLDLGHSFPIIDGKGEDDDPVLEFRPSVGQGFGNTQRVRGYSPEERTYDHGGIMDTCIKGEFTWRVVDHVSLSAYVAYSDYWFDSTMRHCAREHNAEWGKGCDHSWNFYGGLGLSVEF